MSNLLTTGFLYIIIPLIVSIVLSSIIIPHILIVSYKKRLFDEPDGRKLHDKPIPRLGGICFSPIIIASLSFSFALSILTHHHFTIVIISPTFVRFTLLTVGAILLYFTGLLDDLIGLGYKYKFLMQFISASLIPLSGLWINSLDGLFGIYQISPWIGMPLTVFIIIYITNAINLIDGIDGLASGLSMISLFVIGTICFYFGRYCYVVLAFASFGVLIPFWLFNVYGRIEQCRKIFMGDSGSLSLGYILGFLFVYLCMDGNENMPHGMMIIAFSTVMVPVLDIVRVVCSRIKRGCNPFLPDKNHIHHKLLRTGMRVRWVMVSLLSVSFFFILVNLSLVGHINITLIFCIDLFMYIMMQLVINYFIFRHEKLYDIKVQNIRNC
jgi:UDP-GlcNAc:undecaprenyl-phosphate/decaprenyl-phosphate GlcNAc-1-phosphate transferase